MKQNRRRAIAILVWGGAIAALCACAPRGDGVFAPGLAHGANADQMQAGHRLMDAGEYELALRAFTRAAGQQGLAPAILVALGSANLGLGRLGQAETLLRRATDGDPSDPIGWNNLGVVLMERGSYPEAAQVFRRAFALSNGRSDTIRDNLAKALAYRDGSGYVDTNEQGARLIRRGTGDVLLVTGR